MTPIRMPALQVLFVKPWRMTMCETPELRRSLPGTRELFCAVTGDASRHSVEAIHMSSDEWKKFKVVVEGWFFGRDGNIALSVWSACWCGCGPQHVVFLLAKPIRCKCKFETHARK